MIVVCDQSKHQHDLEFSDSCADHFEIWLMDMGVHICQTCVPPCSKTVVIRIPTRIMYCYVVHTIAMLFGLAKLHFIKFVMFQL